jgi:hypothetical protein
MFWGILIKFGIKEGSQCVDRIEHHKGNDVFWILKELWFLELDFFYVHTLFNAMDFRIW